MTARNGETGLRPWDDPNDPEPPAFDGDGRWTAEFAAWAKRSGKRRADFVAAHSGGGR